MRGFELRRKHTHSSSSFWQNSQALGWRTPIALWLILRIRSMWRPYSHPLLTSVRLLCSNSLNIIIIIKKDIQQIFLIARNYLSLIKLDKKSFPITLQQREKLVWAIHVHFQTAINFSPITVDTWLNIILKATFNSQFFNAFQSKKGSIHELRDAVPLHLQRFQ